MARTIIGIVNLVVLVIIAIVAFVCRSAIKSINIDQIKAFSKTTYFLFAVLGVVILGCLIGFSLICFGSVKCCRVSYAIFYIIVIIAEIIFVAVAIKYTKNVDKEAGDYWAESGVNDSVKDGVKKIEKAGKCCGYDKPYANNSAECGFQPSYENTTTCRQLVVDKINANKKRAMIAGIIVIVFQLILFIYAVWYAFCYEDPDSTQKEGITYV